MFICHMQSDRFAVMKKYLVFLCHYFVLQCLFLSVSMVAFASRNCGSCLVPSQVLPFFLLLHARFYLRDHKLMFRMFIEEIHRES